MNDRQFFGKILLFGEYSILVGSDAAVIPYRKVHLKIGFFKECKQPDIMLQSFHEYLVNDDMCREFMNLSKLETDISEGLTIQSDIPMNKGLGSSGAICAGVYDHYRLREPTNIYELRNIFSRMESWFHGKSSGIDPLCIYYNRILIKRNQDYHILADDRLISKNIFRPFLVDTGMESETRPLVEHFREKLGDTEFAVDFTSTYIPLVNLATDQWLNGNLSDQVVHALSNAQLRLFQKMIPLKFAELWHEGLTDKYFAMKLCGSGGGGMFLGFTKDMEHTQRFIKVKYGLNIVEVQSGKQAVIPDQQ